MKGLETFVLSNMAAVEVAIKSHLNLSSITSLNRLLSERGYSRVTTNRNEPTMRITYTRGVPAKEGASYNDLLFKSFSRYVLFVLRPTVHVFIVRRLWLKCQETRRARGRPTARPAER